MNRFSIFILILLFILVMATGMYSVHLGISQMWDIKNYHIYDPFASIHDRYLTDVAPAQLQTFYNPTLDLPFYLLIKYCNEQPQLIAFLLGAVHAFNLFCVALLAWHLLDRIEGATGVRFVLAAIAVLIGATGAGSTPLIGSASGDLPASVPILAALLLAVYAVDQAQTNPTLALRKLAFSGLLAGTAVGLKLTMGIYGLALTAALLVLPRALLPRGFLSFAATGIVGFLAVGGPHHVAMWRLFGNPFFPMFNTLFRSPYWETAGLWDTRFLPKTSFDWIFYPFEWAQNARHGIVSELAFRDIRIALAMLLGLAALAPFGWRLARDGERRTVSPGLCALIIFSLIAYLIWLPMFSIYRYLIPLELLSGIFIVLALGALVTREVWPWLAAAAAGLCIATTIPLEWGHAPFQKRYVEVTGPTLQPDTVIVIVGPDPVAYFVPFFNPKVRWVNVMSNFLRPEQENLLMRHARDIVREHRGRLMVLRAGAAETDFATALAHLSLGLSPGGKCAPIWSNLGSERYQLCPAELQLSEAGPTIDFEAHTNSSNNALPR